MSKSGENQKVLDLWTNCPECGTVNENEQEADVSLECWNCHCVYDDGDLKKAGLTVPKNHIYKKLSVKSLLRIRGEHKNGKP